MGKKLVPILGRTVIGIVAFIVLVIVAEVTIAFLSAHGTLNQNQARVWLIAGMAVIAMIGAMVISVAWMRSIDEAAREAHKAAWFWGGCGGMSVGGVLVILATLPQAAEWRFPASYDGRTDPAAYAATGAFAMILIMGLGYTVVWAWWWLRRR